MTRRSLVVEADGGSRGNPGNAGYGALVRDAVTGTVIAQRAGSVGIATNNVAEYSGLVAGLEALLEVDAGADVEVRMDSKLVVEQMSGRWQIKHEDMRRLAAEARNLLADVSKAGGSVRFRWIPRAQNSAADALANAAMDGRPVSTGPGAPLSPQDTLPDPTDLAVRGGGDRPAGSAARDGAAGAEAAVRHPGLVGLDADSRRAALTSAGSARGGPSLGEPARVVLLRHGITPFTVASKLDGRGGADPSLTALGRRQARAAGDAVRTYLAGQPARVVTSTLDRAVETGALVARALDVAPTPDADWDEQSFGDWDGKSIAQLAARYPEELRALHDDPDYARPGGETHAQLAARVTTAFGRLVGGGPSTTVVATHRKPIMVVLAHLLGTPHDKVWRLATAPASLTVVEVWPDGGASVAFVNDTAHLRGLDL